MTPCRGQSFRAACIQSGNGGVDRARPMWFPFVIAPCRAPCPTHGYRETDGMFGRRSEQILSNSTTRSKHERICESGEPRTDSSFQLRSHLPSQRSRVLIRAFACVWARRVSIPTLKSARPSAPSVTVATNFAPAPKTIRASKNEAEKSCVQNRSASQL